jgi:starvation-inducible outer membrane lipoprotein
MKRLASLLSIASLLTACATAPQPVQILEVCPKVPPLVLDAPERDYLGQMQIFLSGLLVTQPGLKPP